MGGCVGVDGVDCCYSWKRLFWWKGVDGWSGGLSVVQGREEKRREQVQCEMLKKDTARYECKVVGDMRYVQARTLGLKWKGTQYIWLVDTN